MPQNMKGHLTCCTYKQALFTEEMSAHQKKKKNDSKHKYKKQAPKDALKYGWPTHSICISKGAVYRRNEFTSAPPTQCLKEKGIGTDERFDQKIKSNRLFETGIGLMPASRMVGLRCV